MRAIAVSLLALCCVYAAGAEGNWVNVRDKVTVRVEKVLYEKIGHGNCFIHVELQNQVDYAIAVDLSDKWRVFSPNQWGGSDLDHREIINERTILPKELNAELRAQINKDFNAKKLAIIEPGKSIDYYINFNASGRNKLDAAECKYILISIKGQFIFSDGFNVWDVQSTRDLALPKPITWKTIPEKSLIIER